MPDTTKLTDRYDRALLYATQVHGGQLRKATTVPYFAHLMAVSATVLEYGGDEDQAIAGLLHDAVEDQGGRPRLNDIRNRFGARVADMVLACSDNVAEGGSGQPKQDWQTRKERYIKHLHDLDRDILLISLADKTHNARSILRDLRKDEIGASIWQRFSQPKERTLWYYEELAETFKQLLPGQLANELADIVAELKSSD